MPHPSAKKVAASFLRKEGKSISGKAVRFLQEAAAGAKPLIDADAMAEALTALKWEVTPSVEGKVIEGRAAYGAVHTVVEDLKKAVEGYVGPRTEEIEPGIWTSWTGFGAKLARTTIIAAGKKTLGSLRRALDKLTRKTRPGEIGVTVREMAPYRGRADAAWQRRPSFVVFVWINVNVWAIKNPKAKGTGRKPVSLTQKYNANLKLEPASGVKAGQFWNSLYTRGLKAEAAAYLAEQGKDLPSAEELETPEEKVKRTFDQVVRKTLMGFTDKQFKAVVKDYEGYYTRLLDEFLKDQDKAFAEWTAEDERLRAEGKGGARDFSMTGTYKKPTRWKTLLQHISKLLERDEDRSKYRAWVYKKKSTWKADTKKQATDVVTQIRDGFVNKNTMKLSAIVTGKGNLDSIEVLHWSRSNFEGEMLFKFKDGSSFQVRNKTVSKISNRGTWFSQYPTTFHNVIMPDGKKMPSPSEARMVKVFAAV